MVLNYNYDDKVVGYDQRGPLGRVSCELGPSRHHWLDYVILSLEIIFIKFVL